MASALSPEYKLNQSNQQQVSETQQQQYDSSRASTVNGIEVEEAQEQFEALARQLSKSSSAHRAATGEKDVEAGSEDEFDLREYLQSNAAASDDAGIKHKKVGVTFENLTVLGADSVELNIRTFQDALLGNVLWLPMKLASLFGVGKPGSRKLLDDFTGCVKPGEMVLVLGRPGSGCSTFLKTIANQRVGFLGVDGDVSYAGLSAEEFQKRFKGEVVYNQEDDLHFPTLTVKNTLDFALKLKSPGKLLPEQTKETFVDEVRTMLLKMLNISHTENTLVGNEFVRGVSGGERKRVSIAEMLVSRACVLAWDNASRGLDASTALDYAKSIRLLTNINQTATFISLYQAGEGIYNQFDKVLLIDEGKMAYFGPAQEARQYMIDLGFLDLPRQTSGDWLCGITDPNLAAESRFQPGRDATNVPSTPESLAEAYRNSEIRQRMIKEMEDYKAQLAKDRFIEEEFRAAVREDKHKGVSKKSVYTVSFARQVQVLFTRQMQITWGNKFDIIMSYLTTIVLAIVVGSTFLKLPETAAGAFTRGGLLFISVLFNALTAFSELPTQMSGRPILFKQKSFAFFRPAAIGLANVLSEIPFSLPRIFIFGVIVYFMGGLALNAGNFFAFFINIYFSFLAMTSLFRIFGTVCANFNVAARLAAFIITALVLFAGYVIPRDAMARWLFWISYINPLYYGFGALMINEFRSVGAYITPRNVDGTLTQYPANVGPNQVCTLRGAEPGAQFVDGMAYLRASFGYGKVSDQWLYFGVVLIFFLGLSILTMLVTEIYQHGAFSSSLTIVKKPNAEEKKLNEALQQRKERRNNNEKEEESNLKVNACNYTWSNLNYTVPVKGGERRLLHDVFGYCKPGTLTALMGSSGAGKTTLLDVLADRKSIGIIEGDRLVNGRTFGKEFQRGCGYAEQMDIHEGTATLREALRFSAYLRQPASVPKEEKDAWVEEIISLLELEDLADAMIGVPEFGLGVGDRKRATIGVELAAKPDLLLFLDEPTSGLDGQTAYNVVRFLKKLANAGQAIMVTVHQPSSLLFEMMDRLLLLERGGETVYFGPIGKDSKHLVDYFSKHGAHCPSDVNPAEYMLEAIGAGSTKRVGDKPWSDVYRESELFQENLREIERINQEALAIPDDNEEKREYATSYFFQLQTVLKRTILSSWRNADYQFTRLFQHAVIALLTGLLFLQLDNSLSSVQYRVFGVFMMVVLPALILAQIQPFYIQARSIFTREDSSKMYESTILAISQLLSEIPYSAACSVVYFLLFYYVVGFNSDSNRAGYFFAMLFVSEIFSVTFGQAVSAMSPSVYIAALTNPFFLVIFNLFCGVTIPKPNIPGVWRSWLYYVNPFTHLISGVVTNELYGLVVECRPEEFAVFQPPQGANGQPMTCSEWADPFVNAVQAGYINNPNATSDCQYCQYRTGEDFYLPLDIKFSERGREIGIMIAFCAANTLILLAAAKWIKYANR